MIAKVLIFCAALAAAHSTLLAPPVYGHGLAIKAPVAPIYAAGPVLTKSVVAAPAAVTVQRVVTHGAAPLAVAAPLAYAKAPLAYTTLAKAPVSYTTTYAHSGPVAPVLSHTGLLGAAPLAYSGLAGHGLGYGLAGHGLGYGLAGHGLGYGLAGHGLTYGLGGHGLAYGPGLAYGHGLGYGVGKVGYGKVLY